MWLLYALAGLALCAVPLAIAIQRSTDLFVIEIHESRSRLIRGRLPKRLFSELCDVVKRGRVRQGRLRVVVDGGLPRVRASGLSDGVVQQLRNVVGSYQVAQIRNGNLRS